MSVGTTPALAKPANMQRKTPRYKLAVPADLTVLRAGIPDRISGHTVEIGEGGLGVRASTQLLVGECVRVEFLLPQMSTPVRATAVVRYQHERSFGLQFLRLPVEQQSIIRYWTRSEGDLFLPNQKPAAASAEVPAPSFSASPPIAESQPLTSFAADLYAQPAPSQRRTLAIAAPVVLLVMVLGWWQWQQGWAVLETHGQAQESVRPQFTVPSDVMQQHVRHRVVPDYPENARLNGVQGAVVLNLIVDADGAVTQVKVVSGPEELRKAAIEAARWWRFDPYLVNGKPAIVSTTLSMDFRLSK
jgi:TonB family protein